MKPKDEFYHFLGIGICWFLILTGLGGCFYMEQKGEAEYKKAAVNHKP